MNDPGLDGPIANASEEVKSHRREREDVPMDFDEEEEERSFLLPARWWYASTSFPLIAGTFGPMASAFSICALVENWRVSIPDGGTQEHGDDIPDPGWLLAVNAVSLVMAIVANMALLLNMARRLSFKIAQPITIFGFWCASVLLIALVSVAAHDFHARGVANQALTQAYYYAIFAAGLYQIIAYLLMVTTYGAIKGHYSKEFKLTIPQRTLMLQTISFMGYLLLGALVYSKIESWRFLDAVYWADFTLLTIGIGDSYTPQTHLGRGLLFPFAIGGIVIVGLVIGSIRSLLLERTEKKMKARLTEKTRRHVVRRIHAAEKSSTPTDRIRGLKKETAKVLALHPSQSHLEEKRRREAEFNAMRQVQHIANVKRKWAGLIVSVYAWLFLWLLGAFVFYKAEKDQGWTYFESIYFSYTTLLTIGYGDFEPQSNSGKPFFVFWSLLAIPTLTILISNMGDTVVKGVKDVTIWLGELTILPADEGGLRDRLKMILTRLSGGKWNVNKLKSEENEDDIEEQAPGLIHTAHRPKRKVEHNQEDVDAVRGIAADFEEMEKMDEEEARERGDKLSQDVHHYRHLLIKEIKRVYEDAAASVGKKYTYDEWVYFLGLLGEDESEAKYHRSAPIKLENSDLKPAAGETTGSAAAEKEKENREQSGQKHGRLAKEEKAGEDEERHQAVRPWSWVGNRSPLMGDKDEAEWVLEKLFERLETELMHERNVAAKMRQEKKAQHQGRAEDLQKESTGVAWPPPRPADDDASNEKDAEEKTGAPMETEARPEAGRESEESGRKSRESSRTLDHRSGESH